MLFAEPRDLGEMPREQARALGCRAGGRQAACGCLRPDRG